MIGQNAVNAQYISLGQEHIKHIECRMSSRTHSHLGSFQLVLDTELEWIVSYKWSFSLSDTEPVKD